MLLLPLNEKNKGFVKLSILNFEIFHRQKLFEFLIGHKGL